MIGKSLIILFLLCLLCNLSYGSELLSQEALNHYNEGVRAQMGGDLHNAQTNYQRSIILDTKYKKFIFNNFGVTYANDGEMERAEFAFKEALKIDPNYNAAVFNLSLLYLKLSMFYKDKGDVKKAFDYLEKALSLYPEKSFIIEGQKDINRNNP